MKYKEQCELRDAQRALVKLRMEYYRDFHVFKQITQFDVMVAYYEHYFVNSRIPCLIEPEHTYDPYANLASDEEYI